MIHAELRTAYSVGHLERVDQLIDTLEVVAQRAVLPFGIVRAHLCRITNAMARGELAGVPGLIERAVDVGRRLSTTRFRTGDPISNARARTGTGPFG